MKRVYSLGELKVLKKIFLALMDRRPDRKEEYSSRLDSCLELIKSLEKDESQSRFDSDSDENRPK